MSAPSTLIDPSGKVVKALAALSTADDLANATTKDGKSLWEGVDRPSADDLKGAAECFKAIRSAHAELPADGSKIISDTIRTVKQVKAQANSVADEVADLFMDGYHWIKERASEAYDWVVEKIGE